MSHEPNPRAAEPREASPAWARALRETPAACPDLTSRVHGRVQRAREIRRVALAAALLIAAIPFGLAILQGPRGELAKSGAPTGPATTTDPAATTDLAPTRVTPRPADSLAVPSPVARLEILSDQQSAVWAGLEKLTEEL